MINLIMKNNKQAFTLIELLIVIALLGALAVGLLAALDPFEQLKKGTDTGVRNTVSEIQQGAIRFYAIKNHMPWCDPADPTTCGDLTTPVKVSQVDAPTTTAYFSPIQQIIDAGELKTDFKALAGGQLDKVWISGAVDPTPKVVVCYQPISKSFQADNNTKYVVNGVTGSMDGTEVTDGSCKSQGGTTSCGWCVQ